MPPLRTVPPAKPVKTERTHAENQERAYIAASRRSDRSLEARIESARRASEIHKKRTGRSLRVTEADVINEEMYEEEDDDLPAQIRRITAHLHTGNDPFNRRLQAYLANHIAMRSALGQVVADNWQQQQMQNNTLNQYLNPNFIQQQQLQNQQQPFAFQSQMLPPQSPAIARSPSFRASPYPLSSGMQSPRPGTHIRSASIATPQEFSGQQSMMSAAQYSSSSNASPVETKHADRRFSFPAAQTNSFSAAMPHTGSSVDTKDQQNANPATTPGPLHLNLSHPMFTSPFGAISDMGMAPLTATLPLETQQLLAGAPAAEFQDPAMAAMMQSHLVPTPGGNFKSAPGIYSYNPNGSKGKNASFANTTPPNGKIGNMGMDATLAPSMLDIAAPSTMIGSDSMFSSGPMSGLDGLMFDSAMNDTSLTADGAFTNGQLTPGEADWKMWIESQALGDEPVAG